MTTNGKHKFTVFKTQNKQRTTLFFDPPLVKQARVQAIVEETSLTSLVEKALIKYLPKRTVIKNFQIKGGENK